MATFVSASRTSRGINRFLQSLTSADFERLRSNLEPIELVQGQPIYREDGPIDYLYFVDRGMISLVKTMKDGRTVEVSAVGIEGVLGWNAALGMKGALFDAVVQVPGAARRIDSAALRQAVEKSDTLRGRLQNYGEYAVCELAQTAACNRLHSLEERCCRWLLIAHDSARSDTFSVTQEFLSMMLGVQRTAVSIAANILQKAGFIRYSRGRLTVTDRAGLEAGACECYDTIRDRLAFLYSTPTRKS
jgi:CRP-like cAMP-binding protein